MRTGERTYRIPPRTLALSLSVLMFCGLAVSAFPAEAATSDLDKSEKSVGSIIRNYRLLDQDGRYHPFSEYRGKTVLLSFFYVDCPEACPLINQGIDELLGKLRPETVDSLKILSVSLDPENDTPARLSEYASGVAAKHKNWRFNVVDRDTLGLMSRDLGYPIEKNDSGIAHMNRITLIGPKGRVVKHFYGSKFDPAEVEEAVLAAREGRIMPLKMGQLLNRLSVYCSTYDPNSKQYHLDFKYVLSSMMQYILALGTGVYFFISWLRRKPTH